MPGHGMKTRPGAGVEYGCHALGAGAKPVCLAADLLASANHASGSADLLAPA
jgi:hypothetical protein